MLQSISTETAILISLLCPQMPELHKHIIQYAALTPLKTKTASPPTLTLSAQQIQKASSHPSAIIKESLQAIGTVQTTLNRAGATLANIEEQSREITDTLAQLHILEHQGT